MITKRSTSNAENIPVRRASSAAKHSAARKKAHTMPLPRRVAQAGPLVFDVKTYSASKETFITVQLPPRLEKAFVPLPDAAALLARDTLVRDDGGRMFLTLTLLRTPAPSKGPLPPTFPTALPAHAPTTGPSYFLGIYGERSAKVSLHPAHHDILAAHCALLPKHLGAQAAPTGPEIPIHALCLPDPKSYALLSQYMYTHRQDRLFASLLPPGSLPTNPFPATTHLSSSPKIAAEIHPQLLALAESLAKDFTQHKLLGGVATVHGVWKNTKVLGVDDDGLWEVLHAVWGVYLTAAGWTDRRLHLRKGQLIPGYQG